MSTRQRRRGIALLALVATSGALALGTGCDKKEKGKKSDAGVTDSGASTDAAANPDAALAIGLPGTQPDAGPRDEDIPQSNPAELLARLSHLLEAIRENKPELAQDLLFPRDAYLQIRDIQDPARAWEKNILLNFTRDIRGLHRRIKPTDKVQMVSFEIHGSVLQVAKKKHDFTKDLWRVKKSKVSYTLNGKPQDLIIAELTSWRGAWYITNLR